MKKTPNAEQVYSNLRADNDEWHSAAPRLDACLRGVGADLQNAFFGHGHGITVKSVAHFTHFSDLIVKLQRCAKRQLNHGRKDCVQCTSGAAEFWWNLVVSWWPPCGIWWSLFWNLVQSRWSASGIWRCGVFCGILCLFSEVWCSNGNDDLWHVGGISHRERSLTGIRTHFNKSHYTSNIPNHVVNVEDAATGTSH